MAAKGRPLRLDTQNSEVLMTAWSKLSKQRSDDSLTESLSRSSKAVHIASIPQLAVKYGSRYAIEAALPLGVTENAPIAGTIKKRTANSAMQWSRSERAVIECIQFETACLNRNNVTRTAAYQAIFHRRTELHWAMLAHLVSRNGGWNMTDLQGEWLPRLLPLADREAVFEFLERANALIFHDAYPQLLLYEWSLREQRSLFHLLPAFGVSRFMGPVWEQFWKHRDPVPLTVALIVNEQNYIEQRIVQNSYYRERVLDKLFFSMQALLQLNAVIVPYNGIGDNMRLAGLVLESFDSLPERIEFGKRLYAMLFGVPQVWQGALAFTSMVPHSGSRSDYSPQLFDRMRHEPPQTLYKERLLGVSVLKDASVIYSPELIEAWPDRPFAPPEPGDWFCKTEDVAPYFRKLPLPNSFEMTNEYGLLLNKIELAVLAAQKLKG